MADKSVLGKEYPPFTWEVERGKIREMVRALGDNNPIYLDKKAAMMEGYRDTPAPPTYITTAELFIEAEGQAYKDLKFDDAKILHGEQTYQYFQEIYPGDVLTGKIKIIDFKEKEGKSGKMHIVTQEILFTNQKSESVLRAVSTTIEKQ